jgi:hypothetical protein
LQKIPDRFLTRYVASAFVLPFKAPWIGEATPADQLEIIYKRKLKSPLFHPQGVLDHEHYQLESTDKNIPGITELINSYVVLDSLAEKRVLKEPMSCWVPWNELAVRTKSDGYDALKEGDIPAIFGVSMSISPVLLSLLSHVDSLGEDQINAQHGESLFSLRHDGQPSVNERDLASGHDFVYLREPGGERGPDIITSCMGTARFPSNFRSSFAATPMQRKQCKDDQVCPESARFIMYEGLSGASSGLARREYAECMDITTLKALFTIVSEEETLETILKKDVFCEKYFKEDATASDEYHATFFLRATHCILAMIQAKYNGLKEREDIISFVLRLYNLDQNLKEVQNAKLTTVNELKVFGRISELIYFGRVMFNNQFNFRLPMIDGSSRKFGMDYALMRLKPARTCEEACLQERLVFPILPNCIQDEPDYISRMLKQPIILDLYWAGFQSTDLKLRVEMLRGLSKTLNTVAHSIRDNTFRSRMHAILNKEGNEEKFLSPTGPDGNFIWDCEHVYVEKGNMLWFHSTVIKTKMLEFIGHVIEELDRESALGLLEKPEGWRRGVQGETTLAKKIKCSITSLTTRQGQWSNAILNYQALVCLLQFMIHPSFAEEDFHTSMLEVRLEYLLSNGLEFTFNKFEVEGDNTAYERSEYRGNFPGHRTEEWISYNRWARDVVLKFAFFFKGFFQARFRIKDGLRLKELLLAIGQTEVYSMVNTFGHEIALQKTWIKTYPQFMAIMKPTSWTQTQFTNIPQGLLLLWGLAAWKKCTEFSFDDTWATSAVLDEKNRKTMINLTTIPNLIPHFKLDKAGSCSSSALFCKLLGDGNLLGGIEKVLGSDEFPTEFIEDLCKSGLRDSDPEAMGGELAKKCFFPEETNTDAVDHQEQKSDESSDESVANVAKTKRTPTKSTSSSSKGTSRYTSSRKKRKKHKNPKKSGQSSSTNKKRKTSSSRSDQVEEEESKFPSTQEEEEEVDSPPTPSQESLPVSQTAGSERPSRGVEVDSNSESASKITKMVESEELKNSSGPDSETMVVVSSPLDGIAPSLDFVDPDVEGSKLLFNGYECPFFLKEGIPGRPRDFLGDGCCTIYSLFYYLWVTIQEASLPPNFFYPENLPEAKHPVRQKVVAWMRKELQDQWKEGNWESCLGTGEGEGSSLCTYIPENEFQTVGTGMFKRGVDYSDRDPIANLMEGNCVFRLFARRFKVPVVVYMAQYRNNEWMTMLYRVDGSADSESGVKAKDFSDHPLQLVNYYAFQLPPYKDDDENYMIFLEEPDPHSEGTQSHCVILEKEPITRLSAITQGDEIAPAMADPRMTLVVTDCLRNEFVWQDILAELKGCRSSGRIDRFEHNNVSKGGCYLPLARKKGSQTKRLAEDIEKKQKPKPNYRNFLEWNKDYPKKLAYWMDIGMEEVTPIFYANFLKNFRLTKYLPAGEKCLHKHLGGPRERPFIGPLAYLGPSEAVTPIHEDGGGTVDSAHLNVQGYNQILIFPRMEGDPGQMAKKIMGLNESMRWENGENLWPTPDMLRRLLAVRIIPFSVVLSPGELLHINKGRLHCFMKAFAPPPPTAWDGTPCNPPATPALSIAWDWVNIGGVGTWDEVKYSLMRSSDNQTKGVASLAWPETCLIMMLLKMELKDMHPEQLQVTKLILTRQIEWCGIVNGDLTIVEEADEDIDNEANDKLNYEALCKTGYWNLGCIPVPMADAFLCAVCNMELSNVYFQCGGCRTLLNHNFFVCGLCYKAGKHKESMKLENSCAPLLQSSVNHTVCLTSAKCNACSILCTQCRRCVKCRCVCHTKFFLRFRFLDAEKMQLLNTSMPTGN